MPTTTIPPVTGVTTPVVAETKKPDALGKDAFLKLLVAQLKYQDPMSPTDGSALMAQSSQMAMVERLEELASATSKVLAAERSQTAAAFLHQEVTWVGEKGAEQSGVVDSVRLTADGPLLVVGPNTVPIDSVTRVGAAPVPATTPNPSEEG